MVWKGPDGPPEATYTRSTPARTDHLSPSKERNEDTPVAPSTDGPITWITDDAVPGRVEITPGAVASLAARAVGECYGVVGLASRHSRPALAELLRKEESSKGVEVAITNDRVVIDLYVILEYGTRIATVAENIMSSVKFAVEQALGTPAVEVNVNVQGIRVSE
jgi:uncharacterized alkaline shock family protein YloU